MTADSAPRLLTVAEYDKIAEADVFEEDERLELVDGILVSYAPPHGENHAGLVWHIPDVIRRRLGAQAVVWSQLPLIISAMTVLEPDLVVLRPRENGYRRHRPLVSDTYAVVEIAASSLARDRTQKLALYATAGVGEYWIVDVFGSRIEIYRRPSGAVYDVTRVASAGESVSFEAFPDVVFTIDELLD